MSPCHNLEPSLVARDSSRLLSVKPNEWMHLSPFYTRMHGEWLRYAKSTSQFHWRFLLVRDVRGFQVNPLCRHDITSPFPPSGNGGYVRNLDVSHWKCKVSSHDSPTLNDVSVMARKDDQFLEKRFMNYSVLEKNQLLNWYAEKIKRRTINSTLY